MIRRICAALVIASLTMSARATSARLQSATAAAQPLDAIAALVQRLEPIVERADVPAFLALLADGADRNRALTFTSFELLPGARHVVVQERDRTPLKDAPNGDAFRLVLDVFADHGSFARIATWRLDVTRAGQDWRIADAERVTSVENLYRMALNPQKQFDVKGLTLHAVDVDLSLAEGSAFVAEVDLGVTALVLMGQGEMHFHPTPPTERGQLRIFCGKETLDTRFDAAFVRINPGDFNRLVDSTRLTERQTVDRGDLRKAEDIFREESPKSFLLDLGDLSRDPWTLMPPSGDFLAEVRTKRYGTLTYGRSFAEAEDVTLFDRKRHRNISIYSSAEKIAQRGSVYYSEDDLADYDIQNYDIDLTYIPERQWIDGRARVRLKITAAGLGTLTMKLADSLTVRSIASDELGRLFGIRVRNQNLLVINLPTTLARNSEITVSIAYSGRLEPQTPDQEALGLQQPAGTPARGGGDEAPIIIAEPSLLYSNRAFWYPQANASDYATALIRITVPATYECVASGSLVPGAPEFIPAKDQTPARKLYVFDARQPLRYLAFVVSRFVRAETVTVGFPPPAAPSRDGLPALSGSVNHSLNLAVEANPRQANHGREVAERAADIAQFYTSIIGDSPYPSFTVALVESDLPGGHSPGYFAALNQPLPTSPLVWRNDPSAFANFPEFFAAHEIAHQWWGQAVGWRNYHEQWLSEGFAQYFAALYDEHLRGAEAFSGILRQLRKWAMADSDQGPVYLGYRLGHIRGDSRVFRALVYDKGAAVLHMLRRLAGDEAFFRGLQRFYRASRFKKVGTDDLKAAMEQEMGRPLDRFFDGWIFGAALPKIRVTHRIEGQEIVLRAEQIGDELFDVPVPLTLEYADRKTSVVLPLNERACEMRVPLRGTLRGVDVNKDDGTLAEFVR
jgi:hypothetical protein